MSPHHHHTPPPPYETSSSHHSRQQQQHKLHGHHDYHGHHTHHTHHTRDHFPRSHGCHCIGVCTCNHRQPLNLFPQSPHLHYHTFPENPVHVHVTPILPHHQPPVVTNTVFVRRSRSFLCGLFVFLTLFLTFLCLIWMSVPHLNNWVSRHERIRRRHEQGVAWSTPIPGTCVRSGVREYSATLINYHPDNYWREACETTEFYIHGRKVAPIRCDLTPFIFNRVLGHWEIDFYEPQCTPVWSSLLDEGCSGPGERRFSARILNVDDSDQWEHICFTTPLEIQGAEQLPTECTNKGILGMWGHWKVFDEKCDAIL